MKTVKPGESLEVNQTRKTKKSPYNYTVEFCDVKEAWNTVSHLPEIREIICSLMFISDRQLMSILYAKIVNPDTRKAFINACKKIADDNHNNDL